MVIQAQTMMQKAPPHTRGSTRLATLAGPESPGSPAHAGIDPLR